jgi:hypothetical protein
VDDFHILIVPDDIKGTTIRLRLDQWTGKVFGRASLTLRRPLPLRIRLTQPTLQLIGNPGRARAGVG